MTVDYAHLTSRCASDSSVDFLTASGSAIEDFKDFQQAEKLEFSMENHIVQVKLMTVDEPTSGPSKTCLVLVLANGRVLLYENIELFEQQPLEKFRFRLVESPMLLQQPDKNLVKCFARDRECGL